VIVGAPSWSKAGWSRHCRATFRYPPPQQDAAGFVDRIAREVEPGTLVMPMTERTTLPLSARRNDVLSRGGALALPDHEVVARAFNKEQTTALAASLGIATPRTMELSDQEPAANVVEALPFPIVLKPRSSEEIVDGATRATGAPRYAKSVDEFWPAWRDLRSRCRAMLAQEFIPGSGAGYFAMMRNGELCLEFAHRRIRDVRPTGSGSAVRESVAVDPAIRDSGLKILQAIRWHGVAMVEFRQRPDGTLVFLEVNGRFWNSLPLAVFAGADFPARVAELAAGTELLRELPYRVGVRCRWFLGDVRHLIEVMRGPPVGFPGVYPGRLRTLWNFLMPIRGTYHDNFTWDDPLPELGDWLSFTRKLIGKSFA